MGSVRLGANAVDQPRRLAGFGVGDGGDFYSGLAGKSFEHRAGEPLVDAVIQPDACGFVARVRAFASGKPGDGCAAQANRRQPGNGNSESNAIPVQCHEDILVFTMTAMAGTTSQFILAFSPNRGGSLVARGASPWFGSASYHRSPGRGDRTVAFPSRLSPLPGLFAKRRTMIPGLAPWAIRYRPFRGLMRQHTGAPSHGGSRRPS